MAVSRSRHPSEASQQKDVARFRALISEARGPRIYSMLLGIVTFDWPDLMRLIERGLPYGALAYLQRNTGFAIDTLLDWLKISAPTLARRKQQGRFSPEESDRLLRAARVFV